MTAATTTRATISNRDQYEILRRYSTGAELVAIAKDTGLHQDLVAGTVSGLTQFNRNFARTLVEEYERRRASELTLTPIGRPAPVEQVKPLELNTVDIVDDLLCRAEASGDAKLQRMVDRARALIDEIEERYREIESTRAAREEIAALEGKLAEARAKLVKPKPPRVATAEGRPAKIRAWAAANGIECGGTGRVPRDVVEVYEAATGDLS